MYCFSHGSDALVSEEDGVTRLEYVPAIVSGKCSTASVGNLGESRLKRDGWRRFGVNKCSKKSAFNAQNSASAVHFEYCHFAAAAPPLLHLPPLH